MQPNYLCKKCMFCSINFNDIKRHVNKKKSCRNNTESFNYSDDQILVLALIPNSDNENIKEKIKYLEKSDILYKNKDKLFNDISYIDKNKSKKCIYCEHEFNKIIDLKQHLLIDCFYKEFSKNNKIENITNNTTNINSNNDNSITNSHNNITNIYLEIKSPIPFDKEWDTSKIDKLQKENLALSNFMYSKLLEEILKNEINLNVIIDKNNDSGIVYKNDIDKYIQMKSKDIVDNTMDKLKKHLL